MAAPPASAVIPGETGPHPCHHQWFPDERDAFISWLRGEFAAANAIIDSLLDHLRFTGEPGEYDRVAACVQQRRCNWSPVLHLQQYYSIAEVASTLQQAAWRKQQQQRRFGAAPRMTGRDAMYPSRRRPSVSQQEHRFETAREEGGEFKQNGEGQAAKGKESSGAEGAGDISSPQSDCSVRDVDNPIGIGCSELEPANVDEHLNGQSRDNSNGSLPQVSAAIISGQHEKQKSVPVPKVFVHNEMREGRMVNAVEGLELYEKLFDVYDMTKLISITNDMRVAGHSGDHQGQTNVTSKRPMKWHGRDMIQLGFPVTEGPPDETTGNYRENKTVAIPSILQDVFDRLVQMKLLAVKPDFCIIDFLDEGDHKQPQFWPSWYGRPICMLFLTECEVFFGQAISMDCRGDHKGSLKLSLTTGALLVMQDKNGEQAKHAIPSQNKQRIILTFGKLQKKACPTDDLRLPYSSLPPSSSWSSPSNRSRNGARHPSGPNHSAVIPANSSPRAPSVLPQHLPPGNAIQRLVVAPAAVPYPTPGLIPPASAGWTVVISPRHSAPRVPVPGTGVFLPPHGSCSSRPSEEIPVAPVSKTNAASETTGQPKNGNNGMEKANGNCVDLKRL